MVKTLWRKNTTCSSKGYEKTDVEKFFAELGTGGVNLDGVLNQGDQSNVEWFVVEQDRSRRSPLESIEISMNYLKNKQLITN